MIARRSLMVAGLGLGTTLVLPAAAAALARVELDLVDLDVWTGRGGFPARMAIGRGAFLRPEHCVPNSATRSLTALLSPASAALLAEYLRFDRGVAIEEHGADLPGLASAYARVVIARWRRTSLAAASGNIGGRIA